MSLINDALKNIDDRSRQGSPVDHNRTEDTLLRIGSMNTIFCEQNDEIYAVNHSDIYLPKKLSFPILFAVLVLAWFIGLGFTLKGLDHNTVEEYGFISTIHNPSDVILKGKGSSTLKMNAFLEGVVDFDRYFLPNEEEATSHLEKPFWQKSYTFSGEEYPSTVSSSIFVKENRKKTESIRFFNIQDNVLINEIKNKFYSSLNDNRLTTPEKNNALFYLNKIKNMDGQDVFYNKGLLKLEERYRFLIEKNIASRDASIAKKYLNRLLTIIDSQHISNDVVGDSKSYIGQYKEQITLLNSEIEKSSKQKLSIEKVKPSFDETTLLAKRYVNLGRYGDADRLLSEALVTYDASRVSMAGLELLFDVLLELGEIERATSLHQSVKKYPWWHSWDDSYRQALLLSRKNDHRTALQFLSSKDSNRLSENALRLIAGLQQKESAYSKAKITYKKLIDKFGDRATYWLGYAVASDALLEKENALYAFKKTQSLGGLSPKLSVYVNKRIKKLARDVSISDTEDGPQKSKLQLSASQHKPSLGAW